MKFLSGWSQEDAEFFFRLLCSVSVGAFVLFVTGWLILKVGV